MSQRKLFIVAKNIFYWARTETRTFTRQTRTHTHVHTHAYTHLSRSAHYWTSKVKTVLHLSKREWELLFQAGSGSWLSVVAFIFSCCESTTMYRSGVEAEALHHPSRAGEPSPIWLANPLHCSLWLFALGIWKVKWLPCYHFGESIHFVDFGSASSGGCECGPLSLPPPLYFAVRA